MCKNESIGWQHKRCKCKIFVRIYLEREGEVFSHKNIPETSLKEKLFRMDVILIDKFNKKFQKK